MEILCLRLGSLLGGGVALIIRRALGATLLVVVLIATALLEVLAALDDPAPVGLLLLTLQHAQSRFDIAERGFLVLELLHGLHNREREGNMGI